MKRFVLVILITAAAVASVAAQGANQPGPSKKPSPDPPIHNPAPGFKANAMAQLQHSGQKSADAGQSDQPSKTLEADRTPGSAATENGADGSQTSPTQDETSEQPLQSPPMTVQTSEAIFQTGPSGEPRWVTHVKAGEYGRLTPPSGGYVGVGFGSDRQEADTSAAVDFAGSVATQVTSEITEEITESGQNREESVEIRAEIRSQAVLSGMEPAVYRDSDGTWYTLYRITADQYRTLLQHWMDNVELMTEAARRQELQRLEEERLAMERAIEEERLAMEQEAAQRELRDRQAQLEREARLRRRADRQAIKRQIADLERAYLEDQLPPVVLGVDTADPAPGRWMIGSSSGIHQDNNWYSRSTFRLSFPPLLFFEVAGAFGDGGDQGFAFYGTSFNGAIRLVNGAGIASKTSLAIGGRFLLDPRPLFDGESLEPELAYYLAASFRVPRLMHSTYFLYAGTDRAAIGVEWCPLWGFLQDGIVVTAAVDMDLGFREYTTFISPNIDRLIGKVGVGFQPVEAFALSAYLIGRYQFGIDAVISW